MQHFLDKPGLERVWEHTKAYVDKKTETSTFLVKSPVGTIVIWSGTVDDIPKGWHLCDGEDGAPDLRDKFVLGAGDSHPVGDEGGAETVKLTESQMPTHAHQLKQRYGSASVATANSTSPYPLSGTGGSLQDNFFGGSMSTVGSSQPHPNMPPYYALCYIMKITADETDGGFEIGDTLVDNGGVVDVKSPVNGIISQEDFDALPPEEQEHGLWVIPGSGSGGVQTAEETPYNNEATGIEADNVQEAIDKLFQSGSEAKSLIASAVTAKGIETPADATWKQMAENILAIQPDTLYKIGIDWWKSESPVNSTDFYGIGYGNGKFIIIETGGSNGSDAAAFTTDMRTFTKITMPESTRWYDVCYGKDKFVVVSRRDGIAAYSEDGVKFIKTTIPGSPVSVCYGNNIFVAPSYDDAGSSYSSDGISWKKGSCPITGVRDCAFGNNIFVGVNAGRCVYSVDGITWNNTSGGGGYSVAFGNGKFVSVSYGSNTGYYSIDGITWNKMNMPATRNWRWVAYGSNIFVAVAQGTNYGAYSIDGINWSEIELPLSAAWNKIAYGNGIFFAVANGSNTIAYSLNTD